MTRLMLPTLILSVLLGSPRAATITGTVTDQNGNGLAGVGVSLALTGTKTTTDELGGWSLDWSTTAIPDPQGSARASRWTGDAVELALPLGAEVLIDAFSADGASLGRTRLGAMPSGQHRVPLSIRSSGVAWLRVSVDGRVEILHVGVGGASAGRLGEGLRTTSARSLVVPDTLLIRWRSSVRARQLLKAMPISGILIVLDTSSAWIDPVAGTMTDEEDGQVYRTVTIGSQTWLAQNLNRAGAGICPGADGSSTAGSADSCAKYGRFYSWSEAMGISRTFDDVRWNGKDSSHQGICPKGWHLPSDGDWTKLVAAIEKDPRIGAAKAGRALKSVTGWKVASDTATGLDLYGFSGLPAGFREPAGVFRARGGDAYFWSATELDGLKARLGAIYYSYAYFTPYAYAKTYGFSVRCLQN